MAPRLNLNARQKNRELLRCSTETRSPFNSTSEDLSNFVCRATPGDLVGLVVEAVPYEAPQAAT